MNSPFSDPQFQANHAELLSLSPRTTTKTTNHLESFQINNNPSNHNQLPGPPSRGSRGTVHTPTTGASLGNQSTVTAPDHAEMEQIESMSLSEMSPLRSVPEQTIRQIPENANVRRLNPGSLTPNVDSATHHAPTPSPTEVVDHDNDDSLIDHLSDEDIMPQMENRPIPQDNHTNTAGLELGQIRSPRSPRQQTRRRFSDPMSSSHRSSRSLNRRISPQKSTPSMVRNPGDTHHFVMSLLEYRNRKEVCCISLKGGCCRCSK